MEPLNLRNQPVPSVLVVVRFGSVTLTDPSLSRSVTESHDRWGIWGFSVLEVPDGDYKSLARLRPIVATRRRLLVADGPELVASVIRSMGTVTAKAYDLWYDATAVGADLVVLCWISHGPRAVDPVFDPQVGDRLLVGDDEEEEEAPMSARVVRHDGDRVAVQVELPTVTNAVA